MVERRSPLVQVETRRNFDIRHSSVTSPAQRFVFIWCACFSMALPLGTGKGSKSTTTRKCPSTPTGADIYALCAHAWFHAAKRKENQNKVVWFLKLRRKSFQKKVHSSRGDLNKDGHNNTEQSVRSEVKNKHSVEVGGMKNVGLESERELSKTCKKPKTGKSRFSAVDQPGSNKTMKDSGKASPHEDSEKTPCVGGERIAMNLVNEEEASLLDFLWLLLASVIFVPLFQKLPGGSPVLGYLAAGILIGPYGLSIIRNVHATKAMAEFGVVFLLFNIGLEVLVTAAVVGLVAHYVAGQAGPAAIVIGNGLALSSTAFVLQDLAVVVLLILIPLISPNSSKGGIGFQAIAEALGLAAVKAAVAIITAIIAGGRLLLRPIYKQIAENRNAEIFSANTLLVILGTSGTLHGIRSVFGWFTPCGKPETEFSLQVESDIAPYRGLLLGLFFMTVGMSIDPKLLLSNFPVVIGTLGLLILGKTILVVVMGKLFGISVISAIRAGLLLAPGGEFAFVAFGEAVNQGIMSPQLSSLLFLVVGISMAITPWLAAGGQLIASRFELHDVRSLLPVESETDDLQDHIIICGFGRVGQIIAQLLSERLIPFVALDVSSDRVTVGRSMDLPVYFGDAGSREVLHKIGAERACAAVVALDAPGANYRCVWALSKYYPNVKTFVRAHDVVHGLNLEKAGATAVVPETLEPSLQLAAAVLAQAKLPTSEIVNTINEFRTRHLSELTELSEASGSSLGYGFSRTTSKPKAQESDASEENQIMEGGGTLAI
uniref:RCK N-terminal domain-containing protein n=2 Tax=Brassica campestris TaxID=3711 RepID=M4EUU0_BRACM